MTAPAVAVRERPILFSGEMVRAILDGRKTQTRRVVKPQPNNPQVFGVSPIWGYGVAREWPRKLTGVKPGDFFVHAAFNEGGVRVDRFLPCPYGAPGDRLWVRETWATLPCYDHLAPAALPQRAQSILYAVAAGDRQTLVRSYHKVRSSIHMPRWASRLTLEITGIRVERLQDGGDREFWGESIWAENPWVWVIDFARISTPGGARR